MFLNASHNVLQHVETHTQKLRRERERRRLEGPRKREQEYLFRLFPFWAHMPKTIYLGMLGGTLHWQYPCCCFLCQFTVSIFILSHHPIPTARTYQNVSLLPVSVINRWYSFWLQPFKCLKIYPFCSPYCFVFLVPLIFTCVKAKTGTLMKNSSLWLTILNTQLWSGWLVCLFVCGGFVSLKRSRRGGKDVQSSS